MFTHINNKGNPGMVDVSGKEITYRKAQARGYIDVGPEIASHFIDDDIRSPKGPVFQTAIVAATMAVKKTHELIPFCHPLKIEEIHIEIKLIDNRVEVTSQVAVHDRTGVEMEALTGVHVGLLTIYDMCKSFKRPMKISDIEKVPVDSCDSFPSSE
jgi:cyclic pyranopterin phosphate synthase